MGLPKPAVWQSRLATLAALAQSPWTFSAEFSGGKSSVDQGNDPLQSQKKLLIPRLDLARICPAKGP